MIQPSLNNLSDPDFVNQTLVWLYSEYEIKNEVFIQTLRQTDNMGELEATKEMVTRDITRLRWVCYSEIFYIELFTHFYIQSDLVTQLQTMKMENFNWILFSTWKRSLTQGSTEYNLDLVETATDYLLT